MTLRVLICDDHLIVRQGIKQILADAGDIVLLGEAATGPDAIAQVQRREPASLVAHAGGLWMGGTRIARGFGSGFDALRAALEMPEAREILCAMTAEEVVRLGLPIDRIFDFDQAPAALEHMRANRHFGKLILQL